MADYIDLPERLDCEHTDEWLARFTDEQLAAYRTHLVAERATFVDTTPPTSTYRSASYRSYRYGRWIQMVDAELANRDPAVQAARAAKMEVMKQDHSRFAQWVARDLTSNRMRGLYAEWLLSKELGLIGNTSERVEWDMVDIRYKNILIEVKTSGTRQQWGYNTSAPRFSIAPQKHVWDASTNSSRRLEPPRRVANIYVFCLHQCDELSNASVLDRHNWRFWVIPTDLINGSFGSQKSVGLGALQHLSNSYSLAKAVDEIKSFARTFST